MKDFKTIRALYFKLLPTIQYDLPVRSVDNLWPDSDWLKLKPRFTAHI